MFDMQGRMLYASRMFQVTRFLLLPWHVCQIIHAALTAAAQQHAATLSSPSRNCREKPTVLCTIFSL